ncbi:hypothetical protein OROHE_000825 [Orobanche hederae]
MAHGSEQVDQRRATGQSGIHALDEALDEALLRLS